MAAARSPACSASPTRVSARSARPRRSTSRPTLSRWARDEDVLSRWVLSPQYGAGVVLVPMGPERWGPDSEEWVIHVFYPVDADPQESADERVTADARTAMGLRDLADGGAHVRALESRGCDRVSRSARAACSSSGTRRTGTRPRAASASRAGSRTCTTCAGSSPRCSAARRRRRCWTATSPSGEAPSRATPSAASRTPSIT